MKQGQKSVGKNGLQNALFPMDVMYITQGSGGGFSHGGTYAIDFVGWNGSQIPRYPYYAPFDCTLQRKTSDNAGVEWRSDNEVNTPKGKMKVTLVCYHDNDVPNMVVGTKKKQGDFLGRTGTAGNVTGDHAHFEAFKQGQEWVRPGGMLQLWDVLYIDDTKIYQDFGYNWRKVGSNVVPTHCGNRYLTLDEMKDNAQYIANYLIDEGWTSNAIAGMLGNMQTESTINPCIWQNLSEGAIHLGFGLVQWTPATKYIDWCNSNGLNFKTMDANLKRILWEMSNNVQWINPNMSFKQFSQSELSAYDLGLLFLKHYERPANPDQPIRGTQAEFWFNFLDWSGGSGGGTPPEHPKNKNDLISLMLCDTINGWKF